MKDVMIKFQDWIKKYTICKVNFKGQSLSKDK